jgi:hypothetical protein
MAKSDDCTRQKAAARRERERCPWLQGGYRVRVEHTDKLVKKAVVTFLHGVSPAPGYIKHVEWGPHGFQLPLGANKFLITRVYEKAGKTINAFFDSIERCERISRLAVEEALTYAISSSVSNNDDEEFNYPVDDGYLRLGNNGIDVRAGVDFLLHDSKIFTFLSAP